MLMPASRSRQPVGDRFLVDQQRAFGDLRRDARRIDPGGRDLVEQPAVITLARNVGRQQVDREAEVLERAFPRRGACAAPCAGRAATAARRGRRPKPARTAAGRSARSASAPAPRRRRSGRCPARSAAGTGRRPARARSRLRAVRSRVGLAGAVAPVIRRPPSPLTDAVPGQHVSLAALTARMRPGPGTAPSRRHGSETGQ